MPWDLIFQELQRQTVFNQARETANRLQKPLLNAGCGNWPRGIMESDVNLDISPHQDIPNFVCGSVENMSMFTDKQFGAVFCSHVLEHIKDVDRAKTELARVADYQFIITPLPLFLGAWLTPDHRRVFADSQGREILLELPPKPWLE